ncbi:MAG: cellulase family glycosylhydrolase [Candidatus Goldbacteria bacterium]|nr:cellulase family glycosylhydrolase [Candidatus Goldiibacteriota bacterium]
MKKLSLVFILFLFIMSLPGANLIKNGNFEQDENSDGIPDNWLLDDFNNIKLISENENKFIKLSNSNPKYTGLSQYLLIEQEKLKSILVKAKVKLNNVIKGKEDWAYARVLVLFFDKNGNQIGGWPELGRWSGTFNWSEKMNILNVPAETKTIKVEIQLSNCIGEMLIDDLSIEKGSSFNIPSEPDNLIINGDMEYGSTLPLYWGGWVSGKTSFINPGYDSSTAFMIENENPGYSMITQQIPVDTSIIKSIRISGYLKIENVEQGVNPWEKARISVEFHDEKGRIGDWPPTVGELIGTDDEWIYLSRDYSLPNGTKSIIVGAGLLNCKGKVFIDKIKVTGFDEKGRPVKANLFKEEDKSNWFVFEGKKDDYSSDAIIDFTESLDKPAGKHGFITVNKNGELIFEDGERAKFFGTNLVDGDIFRSYEEIDKMVKRLAKLGVNIIRLHHMDAYWGEPNIFDKTKNSTRNFSEDSLNKLDYLIYKLKEAGIYVFLDLLVHRKLKKDDGIENFEKIPAGFKEVIFIDEKLQELTKEYIKNLLEHENAYTKVKYKDEPAIVFMEIINESSIFYWDRNSDIPSFYTEKLNKLFNDYLKNKYGTMDNLKKEWDKYGYNNLNSGEDFNKNTVKRENFKLNWEDFRYFAAPNCPGRAADTKLFYYETEKRMYDDFYNFIKSLGVKALVTGSNHWELWDADIYANSKYDFIDRHSYWDHPSGGWTLQENISFKNLPLLKSKYNCISELAHTRVFKKPFTVSEWNFLMPNEYRAGAPVIMAAYGKFQGWDALLQFNFTNYEWKKELTAFCDFSSSPDILSFWFPAIMIFRYNYLSESKEQFIEYISKDDIFYNTETSFKFINNDFTIPTLIKIAKTYEKENESKNFSPSLKKDAALSLNGELYLNYKKGVFQINADKIQGAIGFLKNNNLRFKNLKLNCSNKYAAVFITSLDNKSLLKSEKIILNTSARVENSDMKFTPAHTSIIYGGNSPIILEPVYATLNISVSKFKNVKIFKLDENNYIKEEYKNFKIIDNVIKITLDEKSKVLNYLIDIQR